MSREQGITSSGAVTSTLEAGILALSLEAWLKQYPTSSCATQISHYLSQVLQNTIPAFSSVATTTSVLDRLSVGQALIHLEPTLSAAEAGALSTLNASLASQKRNQYGGFWYYVYPNWSYLDGTFSFLPFMVLEPGWSESDMLNQITLLHAHCHDNASGLLVHGYDASRTAVWANPTTGGSPYVWGRSLGWYLSGLVNTWEVAAQAPQVPHALLSEIRTQVEALSATLVRFADPETGAWWQLPTFPGREGNFLESSSTALFVFALLKGAREGIVPRDVIGAALRAYSYILDRFVVYNGNGTLGYNGTVSVCSLNSSASYEYYTTRPILPNSLLGEAAFVLASLEVERL